MALRSIIFLLLLFQLLGASFFLLRDTTMGKIKIVDVLVYDKETRIKVFLKMNNMLILNMIKKNIKINGVVII